MYKDAPIYTRCCVWFPLRYGLVTWGYLKLFAGCLYFLYVCMTVQKLIEITEISIMDVLGIIVLVDIVLTITFIVGCHQENAKLLRVYNVYSKILVSLITAYRIYNFGTMIYFVIKFAPNDVMRMLIYATIDFTITILPNIALQVYIILLIRSEIIKLDNKSQCKFMNNIAEAECTVDINNTIEQLEREIEKKKIGQDSNDDMRINV